MVVDLQPLFIFENNTLVLKCVSLTANTLHGNISAKTNNHNQGEELMKRGYSVSNSVRVFAVP